MHANPYLGMLFFLVFPALFVAGLVIMPVGVWLAHRRDAAGLKAWRPRWPKIDLNEAAQRRATAIFLASTLANILIVSVAAYSGIEYMDSPQFCGQLCHEVMEPEWAGYQEGRTRAWRAFSAISAPARPGSSSRRCRGCARCTR